MSQALQANRPSIPPQTQNLACAATGKLFRTPAHPSPDPVPEHSATKAQDEKLQTTAPHEGGNMIKGQLLETAKHSSNTAKDSALHSVTAQETQLASQGGRYQVMPRYKAHTGLPI